MLEGWIHLHQHINSSCVSWCTWNILTSFLCVYGHHKEFLIYHCLTHHASWLHFMLFFHSVSNPFISQSFTLKTLLISCNHTIFQVLVIHGIFMSRHHLYWWLLQMRYYSKAWYSWDEYKSYMYACILQNVLK